MGGERGATVKGRGEGMKGRKGGTEKGPEGRAGNQGASSGRHNEVGADDRRLWGYAPADR